MRTSALALTLLLAGCATIPVTKSEWREVDGAWIEQVVVQPRPWWEPASWLWCGAFGSVCPPGPRPMWSTVLNAVGEATQYLDFYNMPTPK